MTLTEFLKKIGNLNRATVAGKGLAPHKPILLLAVADWFEDHAPTGPLLPFNEDLVRLFKENWNLLAPSNYPYKADLITKPFYYLRSEGFWTPMDQHGPMHEGENRSIKKLMAINAAAQLSDDAFRHYQNPVNRELIRMKLLDTYFPDTKQRYIQAKGMDGLILDVEAEVLRETVEGTTRYERRVMGLREWEGYIRSSKFVDNVRYHYDYTCCISGLHITDYPMMVEACHIKRHSLSGINTVDNGLALCPNLHRAFDAGLISLSDDYRVLVKPTLKEAKSDYALHKLEGKKISLPKEERFWPGLEWVRWQRGNYLVA